MSAPQKSLFAALRQCRAALEQALMESGLPACALELEVENLHFRLLEAVRAEAAAEQAAAEAAGQVQKAAETGEPPVPAAGYPVAAGPAAEPQKPGAPAAPGIRPPKKEAAHGC